MKLQDQIDGVVEALEALSNRISLEDSQAIGDAITLIQRIRPKRSDFVLITIPKDGYGMEVDVSEFHDSMEAHHAFFERLKEPWVNDLVTVYRHNGNGYLDNKWWGGMWPGYARRLPTPPTNGEEK